MRIRTLALVGCLGVAAVSNAFVQDFELFPTGGPFVGGSTGGYPIDIAFYPVGGGGTFDIVDLSNTAGWGNRTLLPDTSGATMMIFNFSTALTSVSIEMGDFNADDDDLFMEAYDAYDAGGSMVDSDFEFYAGFRDISLGDKATLSCAGSGILSIKVWGVGLGGNSNIYMDNLSMVPEPGSIAVLGLGALALIRRRK